MKRYEFYVPPRRLWLKLWLIKFDLVCYYVFGEGLAATLDDLRYNLPWEEE